MPAIKYKVNLIEDKKLYLQTMVSKGKSAARSQTIPGKDIIAALDVSPSMVVETRQRCVEEGSEAALKDRSRSGHAPKLTDKQAAHLIAIACSAAPPGHNHWRLRLLADKMVELAYAPSCSYETIRQLLKKHTKTLAKTGMVHSGSQC